MSKSILLADDSATIRKVVELTFSDTDFHVETVGSGAEALDKLATLRPDIVLADVVMPEPAGYELCRRIKSSDRPVPVLLLAGTFESFDHRQARACGADGCLLKPFETRTLLDRVASLVTEREAVVAAAVEPVESDVEGTVQAVQAAAPAAVPPAPMAPARSSDAAALPAGLGPEAIQAIARAVVEHLSADVIRQIAHEIVPRVTEEIVRRRTREREGGEP